MAGSTGNWHLRELRERSVRLVAEGARQHELEVAAMGEVARLLGIEDAELRRVNAILERPRLSSRPLSTDHATDR